MSKYISKNFKDFPGGTVDRSPLVSEGDRPQSGKIPHAAKRQSPCTRTPEPVPCNKRNHRNEKPSPAMKTSPCSPQLEKVQAQQRRPSATKKKKLSDDKT